MKRQYFTSFEIYDLGKRLGVPISRSVLNWFRKEKLFMPVLMLYRFFVYDRVDVVSIIQRLAERRNVTVIIGEIEKELDDIAENSKVITNIIESARK